MISFAIFSLGLYLWGAHAQNCTGLDPCVVVPSCSNSKASIYLNKLATGAGRSSTLSRVDLCWSQSGFNLVFDMVNQTWFNPNPFTACNSPVYNLNVAETFIVPQFVDEDSPPCYSELDISPNDVMFQSGIYNPNLDGINISSTFMKCETSGVTHETAADQRNQEWEATLMFPWSVVNCPAGCPISNHCLSIKAPTQGSVYRANFFRVAELASIPIGSACTPATCEYVAWNPTFQDPPAFHIPKYFGYLVLGN
jgi:hypothetical protein